MFSKTSLSLFVVGIFIFGLSVLSLPERASAGAALGCCINKSNNCVMCGTGESSCQTEQNGSCPEVTTAENCDGTQDLNGCFVPGAVCFQATNNEGTCGEAPAEPDCTEDADCGPGGEFDDDDICTVDTCEANGVCSHTFDGSLDESCIAPPPLGPLTIIPTMGQWGMLIATILLGLFAVRILMSRKDSDI
jgi:hypothetical protein